MDICRYKIYGLVLVWKVCQKWASNPVQQLHSGRQTERVALAI